MLKKLSLVLASLILGAASVPVMGQTQTFQIIVNGTTPASQWSNAVFFAGEEYIFAVQSPEPNVAFSLCKKPGNSNAAPSCAPGGTTDSYGDWNEHRDQTGVWTSADIGTWVWQVVLADGTKSPEAIFAVLALPGDTKANPPNPPIRQVLSAVNGFPSAALTILQDWLNVLEPAFEEGDISYPAILVANVMVSPSTDLYTRTYAPDRISFGTSITGSKASYSSYYYSLCIEDEHARSFPFFFGSRMEESRAHKGCEDIYRWIAIHNPSAFGVSPVPTFLTDGYLFDSIRDRKAVVYDGAFGLEAYNINTQGVDIHGSAMFDIFSERLRYEGDPFTGIGRMEEAVNLGQFAPLGDQPGNFDGLAGSLGVTNVEGVKPSISWRRMNFGLAPNGVTYLGTSELWMGGLNSAGVIYVGARAGSGFLLDLVQYQNGIPARVAGTVDWAINDSSGKIIASGSTAIPATGSGYMFFSSYPQLQTKGKLLLPEGAYHFTATTRDASGHPSTDPNLLAEDVFAVVDPSRTLVPGDTVWTANGEGGKFGNLGSCNDLSFVAPQGASISGTSGLCFVTNVPKRTAGGYEDVTLRGYGFVRTAVPSSTAPRVVHMKNLDQPALVQGATDLTGKTATSLVPGSIVIFSGWGFTANDASTATPRRPLPGTPHRSPSEMAMAMPPRQTPAPLTEGCTGTDLSDQGRSEVWFSQNGTVAKATILACADNQIEVGVPAGLASGANVAISVVVNGTPGLNALSLPVTAK